MDFGQYAHATLEEVEDELMFQDVLIDSLDLDSDDHVRQLGEIETKKAQLNARRSALSSGPPVMLGMNGANDMDDTTWWQGNGAANGSGSEGAPVQGYGMAGMNGHTHSHSNKRARPESSQFAGQEYPSKRPTPETSSSGGPSPSTQNDWAVRPSQISTSQDAARQRYMAHEAALQRRRQEELSSEKFLRELSQPDRSFAGPSSSRPGVQTTLNHDGSFHRPPPPVKPQPPAAAYEAPAFGLPSQMQPPRTYSQQQSYTMPPVKPEPTTAPRPVTQAQRPRPVVDLTFGDSDDDDLTEILPNQFTPSKRSVARPLPHDRPISRPQLAPVTYPQLGMTSPLRSPMPMPGAYPTPSVTNGYNPGQYVYGPPALNIPAAEPSYHRPPTPTGQFTGIMRQARAALASPLNELNHLINGSSARPMQLGDDDDDSDIEYGGMRQLQPEGYAGLEDLYRSRYDQIADHNPEKTKEEINALLDNIRPDEDVPDELLVRTPGSMNVTLHKYQELGLTWLKQSEEGTNKGGILGDDMGLGKTIQMISLMVTHKSTDPRRKTTLIVAPVSLLHQWRQEIQTRIKPGRHALTIYMHHGPNKKKSHRDLMVYDVVLTTFGSLGAEIKRMEKFYLRKKNDPDARPYPHERCPLIDPDAQWYRIILDEAQNIKNKSTQSAKGACALNGTYRWCMTGTPMMNSVDELYSLIKFCQIRPYNRWEKFRMDFSQPLRGGGDESKTKAMKMLQALCTRIMLRRTKKSKFKGQPIINLPERTTQVDNPEFDEDEQKLYTALQTSTAVTFSKYLAAGTVGRSYTAILVLLLRLRQACCHPHLIKDFSIAAAAGVGIEDMVTLAKELPESAVKRIKATEGNFECPICLDACTNPAIFIPCGHDTCRDCFVTLADPANANHMAEPDADGGASIKCPHCRAKVDPMRITDFNSFKRVHMPEILTAEERGEGEGAEADDDDDDSSDSDTESDGDDDGADLKDFIVDDDEPVEYDEGNVKPAKFKKAKRLPDSDDEDEDKDRVAGPCNQQTLDFKQNGERKKKKKSKKSKKAKGKENALSLAELKKLSLRNAKARKKYMKRLHKDFISSAKIDKTMDILNEIMATPAPDGEKVLIFSQWTSLLDLVEIPVSEKDWGYRRYDGSMNAKMRAEAVDDFKDPRKNVRIMMVSLKAGNAGLNLNVASQVIILDPFWNPYIEDQAIDRAHRIGQMRNVTVRRILVEGTVEDRIVEIQDKKRDLIEEALDEGEGKRISRLGVQELAYLFGITRNANERVQYQERARH